MKKIFKQILNLETHKICLVIFVIAFISRFGWFLVKGRHLDITVPAGGDSIQYDLLAQNLLKYRQFAFEPGKPTAHREPLYPYFLTGVYALFGHSYDAARIVQVIISGLTCVMIFLLALKLFDKKVALLAGVISCFYPYLVYYSTTILRESLSAFLLISTVYFLHKTYFENKILNTLVCGIFLGLCALLNSACLLFVVLTGLIFLISKKFKQTIILVVVFSVIYTSWIIRNYKVFNTLVLGSSAGGVVFYLYTVTPYEIAGTPLEEKFQSIDPVFSKGKQMDEISANKYFIQQAIKIIKENPLEYINRCIKRFIKLYRFYPHRGKMYTHPETILVLVSIFSYGILFPFFIFGFIKSLKLINKYIFLLLPLFSFTAVYTLIWATGRYRLPLEPYIIILGSFGLNEFLLKFK